MARIASVNVGEARPADNNTGRTGIHKAPVAGAVRVGSLGLAGDDVCDARNHGGRDQAVFVYLAEDYAWWSKSLGREIVPGTFGENLTLEGLDEHPAVGDRLLAGELVLEITAPRIPCGTLAKRMGDPGFVKAYREAERPGFYCRVIAEGEVVAGAQVAYEPYAGERVGVTAMFRAFFVGKQSAAELKRALAAPIAARARVDYERLLARAEGG